MHAQIASVISQIKIALEKGLSGALPGTWAQELMRAVPKGTPFPTFKFGKPPRPGGVMIMLYEKDDKILFPLTKRPPYSGIHGGQVSLPGGKAEPGEDPVAAALREGWEEVGVRPDQLSILGKLSPFHVIPSNFIIQPVVAFSDRVLHFVPDHHEVERVLVADLEALMEPSAVIHREIVVRGQFRVMAPCFDVEGETVWGATAMILSELREVIRNGMKG